MAEIMIEDLIDSCLGRKPLDLLIYGQIVNVYSGEVFKGYVGVKRGIIAYVGVNPKPSRERLEYPSEYILPAYIDGHIHIESSLMTPRMFARAVIPHGTCCVIADPHEIANVLGLDGIKFMIESSEKTPLKAYFMIPSSVPSTDLETSGAKIGLDEINALKGFRPILGLGEVMNYVGVVRADKKILEKIYACKGMVIDGHAPGLRGDSLCAYILAGIRSDHEALSPDEAREKIGLGMWIMIREGSTTKALSNLAGIVSRGCPGRVMLVTDDRHAGDIIREGHIDHCLRRAVEEGIDPIDAVKMVTIKPAEYFRLQDLGAISPGKSADIVIVNNLREFRAKLVLIDGTIVSKDGSYLYAEHMEKRTTPLGSINIGELKVEDLRINHPKIKHGRAIVRVIGLVEGQIYTEEEHCEMEVSNWEVKQDPERDILKICVVERHKSSGRIGKGFVRGFMLRRGAIASTVAHDSHNIIAVGVNDNDIYRSILRLREINGGFVIVDGGKVAAELPLPIAGLMADLEAEEIAQKTENLERAASNLGCKTKSPFMALSFLSLPVVPKLKITDYGLIDAEKLKAVDIFVEQ
ncbi:adenine deaminase [Candidatus Bathyarchaeota archaeon]|nr:adenine deaminase [Candidatus Bathyarchaeota archaeon]